ncbi:hypothetical protein GCM10027451_29380 [Geodermatophilus aquaeductus]|uniref:Uncharacterized protein n=1 Tax=Geodermatophilus aquaeductus TaxID=1564161 RepID=A0A521F4U7_9ACTN|nr:hypothetical protein [Geodermatophilus aquaeductus]SMO91217.1 hypothetical protein SAMN06273567_10727 [Geodermatophilus aquaeductus]
MSGGDRLRPGRGDWVTLTGGVRVSRTWMTRHTPRLLGAWCDAPSEEERRAIAARILQVAGGLESEPDDGDRDPGGRDWEVLAGRIDPRLVDGPDWPPLAAALDRAAAAGYDPARRLPALAAATPLPARHPARELHWRLLEDCPAALPRRLDAEGPGASRNPAQPTAHSGPACPQTSADRTARRAGSEPSTPAPPHDPGATR